MSQSLLTMPASVSSEIDLTEGPCEGEDAAAARATAPPKSMVERVTAIVDCFPDAETVLLLEEISQRTCLPRSTTHRILEQLIAQNWMEHTGQGYRLGQRALGPSSVSGATHKLRHAAGPILQDLLLRTGMVVHLSVLERGDIVYIDKLGGRLAVDVPSQVGNCAPANATAGGKAMLSLLDDDDVRMRLGTRLPRLTDRTIATLPTFLMELRRIRQRHGLAFETGEAVDGIACVAAPIRSARGQLAAVSLAARAESTQLQWFAPLVVQATRAIEAALVSGDERPSGSFDRLGELGGEGSSWSPETSQRLLALARQRAWL
jgi:DNA-binding IclR family transcriptional regulator